MLRRLINNRIIIITIIIIIIIRWRVMARQSSEFWGDVWRSQVMVRLW